MSLRRYGAALVAATMTFATAALAQDQSDGFAGKTIRILVGTSPGGGYDLYARIFARHIGDHLPGHPTVLVENMPGAGGYTAARRLVATAPKDGTSLLLVVQTIVVDAMLGEASQIDATKLAWIGRLTSNVAVGSAASGIGVDTAEDLRKRETIFGATARGDTTDYIPRLLNTFAGTKIRVVTGYPGVSELALALERREIEAYVGSWTALKTARAETLKSGKIKVLFQMALNRHPDLPQVPTLDDLAQTDEAKAALRFVASSADIGRSIVAPPGTPPNRVALLRTAFDAMIKDPAFQADAKAQKLDMVAATGRDLETIVRKVEATPKPVIDRTARAMKE